MENEKLEETRQTAIVPTPETTAELIPGQTAELIEKSFAENTMRNRRHALLKFRRVAPGETDHRRITRYLYHTPVRPG